MIGRPTLLIFQTLSKNRSLFELYTKLYKKLYTKLYISDNIAQQKSLYNFSQETQFGGEQLIHG